MIKLKDILKELEYGEKLFADPSYSTSSGRYQNLIKQMYDGETEPDTDEEKAMLEAQAQTAAEPDAMQLAAQAEMVKGQADMLEEKRKGIEMQLDSQNDQAQTKIDAYNAETKRIQAMASVKESESKTQNTNVDTLSKNIDNQAKVIQLSDIKQFTDEQILQQIAQG